MVSMEEKKFKELERARQILGLRMRTSIRTIKEHYRQLMEKVHADNEKNKRTKQKIDEALRTIASYCENYEISFEKDAVEKQNAFADYGEWWLKQFGSDPIWGNPNQTEKKNSK